MSIIAKPAPNGSFTFHMGDIEVGKAYKVRNSQEWEFWPTVVKPAWTSEELQEVIVLMQRFPLTKENGYDHC